jgi:hypothetical protein
MVTSERRRFVSDQRCRQQYVVGSIDEAGVISGYEHQLTVGGVSPRGYTPAAALDANGNVVIVYRGTSDNKLWYVAGTLNEDGSISGSEHRLTVGGVSPRGYDPSIAIDPSGSVLIAYEGTSNSDIWYTSGHLTGTVISGAEHKLSSGSAMRGHHPSVAFHGSGEAFIVYEGTSDNKIWYVRGRLATDAALRDVTESRFDTGMEP